MIGYNGEILFFFYSINNSDIKAEFKFDVKSAGLQICSIAFVPELMYEMEIETNCQLVKFRAFTKYPLQHMTLTAYLFKLTS